MEISTRDDENSIYYEDGNLVGDAVDASGEDLGMTRDVDAEVDPAEEIWKGIQEEYTTPGKGRLAGWRRTRRQGSVPVEFPTKSFREEQE
jgi:hypothetical protein